MIGLFPCLLQGIDWKVGKGWDISSTPGSMSGRKEIEGYSITRSNQSSVWQNFF
jgi:hypothetical protein